MSKTLNIKNLNVNFVKAAAKENLVSGENIKTSFGKLQKIIEALNLVNVDSIPEVIKVPISVPVSAWTASSSGSFNFAATVTAADIKAIDSGHVDFDESSIEAAMDAVIITGSTNNGSITLRAKKMPASDLTGACIVVREAAD